MPDPRRVLNGLRALLLRHPDAVPTPEIRVALAELEAALDAEPAREIEALGQRADLGRTDYGFPTEMHRS